MTIVAMSEQSLMIEWPVWPTYDKWVGEDQGTPQAWTRYKLRSATWFIDVLEQIGSDHDFERLVGVEMALDGAITSLSSSFDAAVAGLIVACEHRLVAQARAHGIPPPEPSDPWTYHWKAAVGHLLDKRVTGGVSGTVAACAGLSRNVEAALANGPQIGWLETFRRLRNRATHQDTLARHIDVHVGGTQDRTAWQLTVSGQGVDPVAYLRGIHGRLQSLTDLILQIAELLAPNGMTTTPAADSHSATVLGGPPASASGVAQVGRPHSV